MKPRLLFLCGMMCDERLFAPQITAFSSDWDIAVADFSHQKTIRAMAETAHSLLPNGGAVVGLSMGGIVAMELNRIAPEKIHKIVLMDTNPFAEKIEMRHRRDHQMQQVKEGKLTEIMRDELKPNYLVDPNNTKILDLCLDMGMKLGADCFINQSKALQERSDQSPYLAQIRCPTLVACGIDDQLCPPERHDYLARHIPDTRYAVIAEAGHLPTLEQPDNTTYLLQNFLGASS